jgi:hypothetical protein
MKKEKTARNKARRIICGRRGKCSFSKGVISIVFRRILIPAKKGLIRLKYNASKKVMI